MKIEVKNAIVRCKNIFERFEEIALTNQKKVLDAFIDNKIALRHFSATSGYGYDDVGRDTLCNLFATIFGAESAIVSPNIVSGTHALTIALFGLLRPGDTLLCVTGAPYDTLREVIGGENIGSLKDYGVNYDEIPLKDYEIDEDAISTYLSENSPKVIMITRSRL